MTRKVFAFAKGECCAESADNPAFQEVLLGGHLYMMLLKVEHVKIYIAVNVHFKVLYFGHEQILNIRVYNPYDAA